MEDLIHQAKENPMKYWKTWLAGYTFETPQILKIYITHNYYTQWEQLGVPHAYLQPQQGQSLHHPHQPALLCPSQNKPPHLTGGKVKPATIQTFKCRANLRTYIGEHL